MAPRDKANTPGGPGPQSTGQGAGPSCRKQLWDFSWAWGNKELSDIIMQFEAGPSTGEGSSDASAAAEDAEDACTFHCHQVVLSAGSVYFRTLFTSPEWFQSRAEPNHPSTSEPPPVKRQRKGKKAAEAQSAAETGGTAGSGRSLRVHVEHVDPADLAVAVPTFMRFLYLGTFTQEVARDPAALVQVTMLADRYDCPGCVAACAEALSCLQPEQLDVPSIAAALQLPDSLLQLEECKKLVGTCTTRIIQLLGDTSKIVSEEVARLEFSALPFSLLKLWAASDDLVVDSENTVLVLLTWWVMQQRESGQSPSKHKLQELSALVRVRHLSQDFQASVLSDLDWFQATTPQLRVIMAAFKDADSIHPGMASFLALPPAWCGRARTASAARRSIDWEWQVDGAALQLALEQLLETGETQKSVSNWHYVSGMCFRSQFTPKQNKNDAQPASVGVFIEAAVGLPPCGACPAMHSTTDWVVRAVVSMQAAALVRQPGYNGLRDARFVVTREIPQWGSTKFLSKAEDLQQYLTDGKMTIRFSVGVLP